MAGPMRPSHRVVKPRGRPLPDDLRAAIEYIRVNAGRPISMADVVNHCGVPARTLRKYFHSFLGISPMRFWRGVRLTAARKDLLGAGSGISVTEAATAAGFNHFGRFAQQYQRAFGEAPSATLRRNKLVKRAAPKQYPAGVSENGAIAPFGMRRERPSLAVLPCQVSSSAPECRRFAEYLSETLTTALGASRSVSLVALGWPRAANTINPQRFARERGARYLLTGRMAQSGEQVRVAIRLVDAVTELHIWGDN